MKRGLGILAIILFAIPLASAADPGHSASAINPGIFTAGDYIFKDLGANPLLSIIASSGTVRIGGIFDSAGVTVTNVSIPFNPRDAANKAYTDNRVGQMPGLLIPLYIYPANIYTNDTYNNLISLSKRYHNVQVYAILNPSNGPGDAWDGNYKVAVERLHGAGIKVLGYIATNYSSVSLASAQANVSKWQELYSAIDGIFMDEMSNYENSAGNISYYNDLTSYIHSKGLYPSIGNPGAGCVGDYFGNKTADVIVIHENRNWPSETDLRGDYENGYSAFNYNRRAALVYNQSSIDLVNFSIMRKYVGLVYVDDDDLPNPWDTLPSYLESLFKLLSAPEGAYFADNVDLNGLLRLKPIALPACDSSIAGAIGYNNSGHYGCHSNVWNKLY